MNSFLFIVKAFLVDYRYIELPGYTEILLNMATTIVVAMILSCAAADRWATVFHEVEGFLLLRNLGLFRIVSWCCNKNAERTCLC